MLRREGVWFNFIFPARAESKASFSDWVVCHTKSKFPEVSEIAELRCMMTAATHPPTHSLIRHNAVLFLVTITGPPGESRKLFIFCYITSLCLRRLVCVRSVFSWWCKSALSSGSWIPPISQHLTGLFPEQCIAGSRSSSRISCRSPFWKAETQRQRERVDSYVTWSQSKTITSWIPEALFMFGEIFPSAWNQREAKGWEMPASPWKELLISYVSYLRFCWLRGRNRRSQNALPCVLVPKIMLYVRMPDPFHAPCLLMLSHCKARKHLLSNLRFKNSSQCIWGFVCTGRRAWRERFLSHTWSFDSANILLHLEILILISCYGTCLGTPPPTLEHYYEEPVADSFLLLHLGRNSMVLHKIVSK